MRSLAILTLAVALFVACTPEPREPKPLEIETVEVGGTVDKGLSTEGDEKGTPPEARDGWILSGVLPDDLPLHRPARLVGSDETADGRQIFVFHTTTTVETVRSGLERRLREAGWSIRAGGETLTVTKGSERATYTFAPLTPGTEIRVAY